jgi:hypothetical protein
MRDTRIFKMWLVPSGAIQYEELVDQEVDPVDGLALRNYRHHVRGARQAVKENIEQRAQVRCRQGDHLHPPHVRHCVRQQRRSFATLAPPPQQAEALRAVQVPHPFVQFMQIACSTGVELLLGLR